MSNDAVKGEAGSPSGKPAGRGSAARNVTETQGKKGHGQQKLKQKKK